MQASFFFSLSWQTSSKKRKQREVTHVLRALLSCARGAVQGVRDGRSVSGREGSWKKITR